MTALEHCQPGRWLIRCGPFDSMFPVSRTGNEVTWLQFHAFVFNGKSSHSSKQNNPFMLILVVPEAIGRRVTMRDDLLDANVSRFKQRYEEFARKFGWQVREKIIAVHTRITVLEANECRSVPHCEILANPPRVPI